MPMWMALSFQDSNSPLMEHLSFFHDHSMVIVSSITAMIGYLLVSSVLNSSFSRTASGSEEMELFWTSLPVFMLIFIAMPSLKILYVTDELLNPSLTLKTTGHQWFWSYEYSEFKNIKFESYMEQNSFPRLLDTNNHIILPNKTPIRMIISSTDVIHSWTIPSLGVKADAIPGRLNQIFFLINRIGMMTGQCSEICGANHSFMPITISSTTPINFVDQIKSL
uniref:Cytochrome c oxidase subunit 2 n=1 Tax=Arrenurus rostratus TaxID=3136836 RepID=A0AAU6QE18_9ACAR